MMSTPNTNFYSSMLLMLNSRKEILNVINVCVAFQYGMGTSRHYTVKNQPKLKAWPSQEVRQTFIDYFKKKDHLYVPSSSVIPKKSEHMYFVNAGMNQVRRIAFIEFFIPLKKRSFAIFKGHQKIPKVK